MPKFTPAVQELENEYAAPQRIDEINPTTAGGKRGTNIVLLDRGGSFFDAEAEGITPDGITDRLADLQALEALALAEKKAIRLKAGDGYVLSAKWSPKVPIVCEDSEPAILLPTGAFRALEFHGDATGAVTTLAVDTEMNQEAITVVDATGFAAGQLITLRSDALWYYDNRGSLYKGETHLVRKVEGNTLYLDACTWDSYDLSVETVTVTAIDPISPWIENVRVKYPGPTDVGAISLAYCKHAKIWSLGAEDAQTIGAIINTCYQTDIQHFEARRINNYTTGYGIQDSASYGTTVRRMLTQGCRRGIDFSGIHPSRGGLVSECEFHGGGVLSDGGSEDQIGGFATHGTAESIRFYDNRVINCAWGGVIRGRNIEIKRNQFVGRFIGGGLSVSAGANLIVEDNVVDANIAPNKSQVGGNLALLTMPNFITFSQEYDWDGYTSIKRNKIRSIQAYFIQLYDTVGTPVRNLEVTDNEIEIRWTSNLSDVHLVKAAAAVTIEDSVFLRNDVRVHTGRYSMFSSNVTPDLDTIDVDKYRITDPAALEVWSGGAALANVTVDLVVERVSAERTPLAVDGAGITRVRGYVAFDVTGSSALLRIAGLPAPAVTPQAAPILDGTYTPRMAVMWDNLGNLYLSADQASYNTGWPIAAGYVVPIDISYR